MQETKEDSNVEMESTNTYITVKGTLKTIYTIPIVKFTGMGAFFSDTGIFYCKNKVVFMVAGCVL